MCYQHQCTNFAETLPTMEDKLNFYIIIFLLLRKSILHIIINATCKRSHKMKLTFYGAHTAQNGATKTIKRQHVITKLLPDKFMENENR